MMYAQGDVLIVSCHTIPATAAPVAAENGRLIVARGEATGHHHSFRWQKGAVLFRDDGAGGALYVDVASPATLEHQEHASITLPAGRYRVLRQRVARAGMARRVED